MKSRIVTVSIVLAGLAAGLGLVALVSPEARAQLIQLKFVRLQTTTPGTPDSGNVNVSGRIIGNDFVGDGSGLVNLNASNILNGTLPFEVIPVPLHLVHDNAGSATAIFENTAAGGSALDLLGNFNVGPGGKFRVDAVTGNALSQGTVTANGLFSADDAEVGGNFVTLGNAQIGGLLDMTSGGISNIGTGGSAFSPEGDLDVFGNLIVTPPGGLAQVYTTNDDFRAEVRDIISFFSFNEVSILGVARVDITSSNRLNFTGGTSSAVIDSDGLTLSHDLHLAKKFFDGAASPGANGDLLMSTGTATRWVNLVGADGESLIVRGDASIGGASAPRIFSVERTPSPRVTVRGLTDLIGPVCTDNSLAFKISSGTPATPVHIKSPITDALSFHTANTERMRIGANGSVNIGTTTGAGRLNVNGNLIMQGTGSIFAVDTTIASFSGSGRAYAFVNGGWGEQRARNNLAQDVFLVTGPASGFSDGFVAGTINNAGSALIGGFHRIQSTNTANIFANGTKSFVEPNPDDPSTDIYYAALEGPEAGMYVRGTARLVGGRAVIHLPDHFTALADPQGMTVQLTPISFDSKGLAVGDKSLAGIVVGELHGGKGTYEFDWEVKAIRRKFRDYRVLRPWDDLLLPDADRGRAWEERLRSLRN